MSDIQVDHRELVRRLCKTPEELMKEITGDKLHLQHALMGLISEVGEIGTTIKKTCIYNAPLDKENILEEAGDLLFYLNQLLMECGFTIPAALRHNLRKLNKRYPSGYNDSDALIRRDKQEGTT